MQNNTQNFANGQKFRESPSKIKACHLILQALNHEIQESLKHR